MACVSLEVAAYGAGAAVVLAVISPKDWHDVALDAARQKWGVGPGGSATEDAEEVRQ